MPFAKTWVLNLSIAKHRAVTKSRGLGISPGYYECGRRLVGKENRRKIETKEIPSCLIPCLLVVFTRQLEILATSLQASIFESLCDNDQFYWPKFCLLFFHLSPQVALEGLRPSVPPGSSTQMSKLVSICWNNDPTKRPRFDQILPILSKMAQ